MSEVGSDTLPPASSSPAVVAEPSAPSAGATTSTSQGRHTASAVPASSTSGLPKSFREALDQWDQTDQEPSSAQRSPNGPDPAVTGDGAAGEAAAAPDPVKLETDIRAKVEAELKNDPRYQVAQQFDPREFSEAVDELRLMRSNPTEFHRQFGEKLRQAGLLPNDAPDPFSLPDADLEAEDGTKAYSAERLADIVNGLQRQIDAKIQPFAQERAERQREQQKAETFSRAKTMVEDAAKKYDGFTELRPQIVQEMLRDKQTGQFRSLEQVYLDVYNKQYLPKRDEKVRQKHAEELRAKAAVTATRPTGGVPRGGSTGPAKTFRQAIERNGGSSVADSVFGR